MRTPLVALMDTQLRRSNRAGWTYSAVGAVFTGAGGVGMLSDRRAGVPLGLVGGGLGQVLTSQLQLSVARRRHASFHARLAAIEGRPEAIRALALDMRRDSERQARQHALATGIWGALAFAGGAIFAADRDDRGGVGLGIALTSVGGLLHHGTRWQSASRFAADLDTLWWPPPTVVPTPVR